MKCNLCGQEYEFSLGHRCQVMQEESKQPMPQPHLVSKLREVISSKRKWANTVIEVSADSGYFCAGDIIAFCDELESLLGLEGQAVAVSNQVQCASCGATMLADGIPGQLYCPKCQPSPSTPIQPDTSPRNLNYSDDLRRDLQDEDFRFEYLSACAKDSGEALRIGIRNVLEAMQPPVQAEGQAGRALNVEQVQQAIVDSWDGVNDCIVPEEFTRRLNALLATAPPEQASRSMQRRKALQKGEPMPTFEPSTPIVPGTAGLSADWPECKDFFDLMQYYRHAPVTDQPFTVKRYELVKEWLRSQVNALLGAEKLAEPGVPLIHGRVELDIHDARIRKDVLEEAAQLLKYCGYSANLVDEIRALAERPAPAGEVKGERE